MQLPESTAASSYLIEIDDQKKLLRLRRSFDGEDIPLDSLNREYCRFLTWAVQQQSLPIGIPLGALPGNARYVATVEEVVDHFKDHSLMLFVRTDQLLGGQIETRSQAGAHEGTMHHSRDAKVKNGGTGNQIDFYPLFRATPSKAGDSRLIPAPSGLMVSQALLTAIATELAEENSDIRCLSTWPVERTFVYFDVSDFSTLPVGSQAIVINQLTSITKERILWPKGTRPNLAIENLEASLCIGDGYIFVFSDPYLAVYFAAYIACVVEELVAMDAFDDWHFRMSVHTGPVFRFWDQWSAHTGKWNYVGLGITTGRRVLSAIGRQQDDIVYVSADTRSRMRAHPGQADVMLWLQNRGRRADKHGHLRRLYELNHTGWIRPSIELIIADFRRQYGFSSGGG